jgi:hypothetical protein
MTGEECGKRQLGLIRNTILLLPGRTKKNNETPQPGCLVTNRLLNWSIPDCKFEELLPELACFVFTLFT